MYRTTIGDYIFGRVAQVQILFAICRAGTTNYAMLHFDQKDRRSTVLFILLFLKTVCYLFFQEELPTFLYILLSLQDYPPRQDGE